MKLNKFNLKSFVAGVITTTLLGSSIIFAAPQSVTAYLRNFDIKVNNELVSVNTLVYNDSTYIALRSLSDVLNKEVGFNNDTVYIDESGTNRTFENDTPASTNTSYNILGTSIPSFKQFSANETVEVEKDSYAKYIYYPVANINESVTSYDALLIKDGFSIVNSNGSNYNQTTVYKKGNIKVVVNKVSGNNQNKVIVSCTLED